MIAIRMLPKGSGLSMAAAAALVAGVTAGDVRAHDPQAHMHHNHMQAPASEEVTSATVTLSDAQVVSSWGQSMRFRTDLIGNKAVAINFIYTSCTTICPPLSGIFESVQTQLGDRLGRDIRLITVSIDPTVDTPQRMATMAARFHAGPDWLWVTGSKDAIDTVLKSLDAYTPDIESHPPVVMVGADGSEPWTRLYGFSDPEEIVTRVTTLADRMAANQKRADSGRR